MKRKKLVSPSITLVIAAVALLGIYGGPAHAKSTAESSADRASTPTKVAEGEFGVESGARKSRRRSGQRVRTGKFVDTDTTLGDGNFAPAKGIARCKRRERLTGGGVRRINSDGLFPGVRWILQESGPVPSKREYVATAVSDLGGLGRKDFIVIALCEPRRR